MESNTKKKQKENVEKGDNFQNNVQNRNKTTFFNRIFLSWHTSRDKQQQEQNQRKIPSLFLFYFVGIWNFSNFDLKKTKTRNFAFCEIFKIFFLKN